MEYLARVLDSPSGQAEFTFQLPIDEKDLEYSIFVSVGSARGCAG